MIKLPSSKKNLRILSKTNKTNHKQKKKVVLVSGFKISTELVAALIVGVGIGLIVDNYFRTKPFGLIIFFILGAFAGFLNVYRVMRRIEKQ